jgi:hypothetical protein
VDMWKARRVRGIVAPSHCELGSKYRIVQGRMWHWGREVTMLSRSHPSYTRAECHEQTLSLFLSVDETPTWLLYKWRAKV